MGNTKRNVYKGQQYRSGFEVKVAKQLDELGVKFTYESRRIYYTLPVHKGACAECDSNKVVSNHFYTPDFLLENGIVLEAKGKLDSKHRRILKAIKDQHPEEDLRLIFMLDNKISRGSKTRYTAWAASSGIPSCVKEIPPEWIS